MIFLIFCRYFKYELEAKGEIARIDLPPIFSSWLDCSSQYCMYISNQLRTYTTAHLSGGGWYIDYPISYTHLSEVQLRKSLEGIGTIDLEVDDFVGFTEAQRKRAIAKRDNINRRKEAQLQVAMETKEKKEAKHLVKLVEKEKKEGEREGRKGQSKREEEGR